MSESGEKGRQAFGLISFALVPFGVLFYVYSDRILSDIETLPEEMLTELVVYPSGTGGLENRLLTVRMAGGAMVVFGLVLLGVYVLDYLVNTDSYADRHDKKAAIFGSVAGLVWIFGIAIVGYGPAVTSIDQYLYIAEHGTENAAEVLARTAGGYERSVLRYSISAGGIMLGCIWWGISVLSLIVQPNKGSKTIHCSTCGGEMPKGRYDRCPYCSREI
jgi:hypothetical protein